MRVILHPLDYRDRLGHFETNNQRLVSCTKLNVNGQMGISI